MRQACYGLFCFSFRRHFQCVIFCIIYTFHMQFVSFGDLVTAAKVLRNIWSIYSPFHSSLSFAHLGQSNLFTRVCRLFVNQVTFYSILELKQCPRCHVFLHVKSIQHLFLGNDVTSSDKNMIIAWLKHTFISKFFAQHKQCILRTRICNRIETKTKFYQFKQYLIGIYMAKIPHGKLKISLEF